ncbi:carcinoembryonic antigen-related cell adhesion molecule 2-like [Scyliorhinus canicula]|uniref:carcinoembryonic antigen-related cell adhesion molecule 2-like n=1 Tax=Scyliorhinus canicula TaxID=7830 RepID=UPI0018F73360|nr:carcinoembryonic antigen-related cell adhesion molecule 2-like [Scyliorhinus canicula]
MHCLFRLSVALSCFAQVLNGQVKMEVYRAPGSSMFFPGAFDDHRDQAEFFQWKVFSGNPGNATGMGVLQYRKGDIRPSLMKKYRGRLDVFPPNGSFVLHNLTFSDAGLYTLSINLRKIVAQNVRLKIIDELTKASILSNSSSLGSTTALTCDVSGEPHWYQWQKDGGEISPHHRLINGNRSLIIPNTTKDDNGMYTCISINPVSTTRANYTLTISDKKEDRNSCIRSSNQMQGDTEAQNQNGINPNPESEPLQLTRVDTTAVNSDQSNV